MKKGVIALLLALALIILVSPGIIGKLAERRVNENLEWAATKSGHLVVTSSGFDRGWFSSEGQHRVALGDGMILAAMISEGEDIPVLVINTHLDHGLVPLASMAREGGSLAPGLGSAVSTLSIEYGEDETIEIPGKIFSDLGLGGDLRSSYVLAASSKTNGGKTATWEDVRINISTSPRNGSVTFDGDIGALSFEDDQEVASFGGLTFMGNQTMTQYGFATGHAEATLGAVAVETDGVLTTVMNGMAFTANSAVNDGLFDADTYIQITGQAIPGLGDVSVTANIVLAGADAVALGVLTQRLDLMSASTDPAQVIMLAGEDFKDLFAAGFEVRFDRLDVELPMGTVTSKISFEVPQTDRASFEWTSLLLGVVASADITVPQGLVDFALQMNPQAADAIISMGYLKQKGDVYELEAHYKKGLLTVNGVPIPLGELVTDLYIE